MYDDSAALVFNNAKDSSLSALQDLSDKDPDHHDFLKQFDVPILNDEELEAMSEDVRSEYDKLNEQHAKDRDHYA